MSEALKNLKKNFKKQLASKEGELHKIDVATEVLKMDAYACGVITAQRKNRIFLALENDGQVAFCAEMMIQCLTDENRKHLFQNGERLDMMQYCSADDIELIAGKISSFVFGSDNIEEVIARETGGADSDIESTPDDRTEEEQVAGKNSKKTSKS